MDGSPNKPPQKTRADWTAWTLQLLFGMSVGACGGYLIWGRMLRFGLVSIDQWLGIIVSVAFVVGAITSRRGDRTWFRASLFDPEPPPQSPASKAASIIIGSYGILLFCLILFSHLVETRRRSGFWALDGFMCFLGVFIAFLVIHALRTGTAFHQHGFIDREESPLAFWLYVAFGIVSVLHVVVNVLI